MLQVVETGFPEFTTFSVGEGDDRRTVVCFQQQLLDYTLGNIRWEKARDTGEYVGEVMVHHDKLDTNFLITDDAGCESVCDGSINNIAQPDSCQQQQTTTDTSTAGSLNKNKKSSPSSSPKRSSPSSKKPSPTSSSKRTKRPERAVYVPPVGRGKPLSVNAAEFKPNSPGHVLASDTSPDHETEDETRDVTDQVVTEITTALGGVQIESPAVDYSRFQTSDSTINIDQFGHVIELYDFPSEMKTNDLMAAFSAFTSR